MAEAESNSSLASYLHDHVEYHKFIFVGGLHRSGTTLLQRYIRNHPLVSGFQDTSVLKDEGQFIQDIYPLEREHGGPGRFGFHTKSFMNEGHSLVSEENAMAIFASWARHWDLNKPYLLEKTPANLVRSRFLQALFPKTFFVIIIRHPIAVAYATRKWIGPLHVVRRRISSLIWHWLICHKQFCADSNSLENVIVVRYEDFVANPGRVGNRIFQFLDLEPVTPSIEVKSGVNRRYFSRWEALSNGNLLERLYAIGIRGLFEEDVNRFGYRLEPPYVI